MLMPMIALVMLWHGEAINTDLRFTSREACEAAVAEIQAVEGSRYLKAVCVEVR